MKAKLVILIVGAALVAVTFGVNQIAQAKKSYSCYFPNICPSSQPADSEGSKRLNYIANTNFAFLGADFDLMSSSGGDFQFNRQLIVFCTDHSDVGHNGYYWTVRNGGYNQADWGPYYCAGWPFAYPAGMGFGTDIY
jgi:hypothetical protein